MREEAEVASWHFDRLAANTPAERPSRFEAGISLGVVSYGEHQLVEMSPQLVVVEDVSGVLAKLVLEPVGGIRGAVLIGCCPSYELAVHLGEGAFPELRHSPSRSAATTQIVERGEEFDPHLTIG